MAQRARNAVRCDVGGEELDPDTPTVTFGVDGKLWKTERCDVEQAAMIAAMAPFIEHARNVQPRRQSPRTQASRRRAGTVRAWAVERGLCLERGRIPAAVVAAYDKEHR